MLSIRKEAYIKKFLLLSCLVFCSYVSAVITPPAEFGKATNVLVSQNGSLSSIYATNARGGIWAGTVNHANGFYITHHGKHATVQSAATGATSAGTVKATFKASVSKRSVFDNVLKNARSYGKGLKGFGWQGLAFQLALDALTEKGYQWRNDAQDFVTTVPDANYVCVAEMNVNCLKTKKSIIQVLPEVYTNKQFYELKSALCDRWIAKNMPELPQGYELGYAGIDGSGQYCIYTGKQGGVWISGSLQSGRKTIDLPIDEDKFAEYAEPLADNAPSDWVRASANDKGDIPGMSKPSVTVADGTVAQSAPYTNSKTGNAEQITWTFHTPAGGGETTVTEKVTLRPDLTPNSPEAPAVTPPETDTDTETKPDEKEKDKDKKPTESGLCDMYPDILACDKTPTPKEDVELEIPQKEVQLTFDKDTLFDEAGRCPDPITFSIFGGTFGFSLQYVCEIALRMRPILIAFAWLAAAVFVVRTVQSEL